MARSNLSIKLGMKRIPKWLWSPSLLRGDSPPMRKSREDLSKSSKLAIFQTFFWCSVELTFMSLCFSGEVSFHRYIPRIGAVDGNADLGILILRDQARVSLGFGRMKEKSLFLFQNCLVFATSKSLEQVIVHQVPSSDLLEVRYRAEDPRKGSGVLTIYWREVQSKWQEVYGAQLFSTIWTC
jgi:hypothetical protein